MATIPAPRKPGTDMSPEEREIHIGYMKEALSMAEYALNHSETPVGCIFVYEPPSRSSSDSTTSSSSPPSRDSKASIISQGYNLTNQTYNGTRHAEFVALNQILTASSLSIPSLSPSKSLDLEDRLEILKNCTLYVTVEPCIMCASLLRQFGIRRVFYGASNEKFGGTGGVLNIQESNGRYDSFPRSQKTDEEMVGEDGGREGKAQEKDEDDYEVSGGWLREEAILMLRRFYVQENERAPEEKSGKEGRVLRLDVD